MKKYLVALFEEKNISLETSIEAQGESGTNFMTLQIVVDAIVIAPKHEQRKIKDILVQIDFKNGDVLHFMKHLANALAI
ncbi:hypothetical protein [Sulfurimonas sp.]|uniref:hypothetical protein n=1 Tax=Sulfurimonas sp. TaxID=2022749 RepID=UPI002607C7F4|nr:hypothetical protein [Sulfurimonas sp.]MDD3450955.1 hypothetical protein [Sulfurimonas sp.]